MFINLSKQAAKAHLLCITPHHLQRGELKILEALNWDMRVVTAFCFVPYYTPKFSPTDGFNRRTINEIIIQSQQSKFGSFSYS